MSSRTESISSGRLTIGHDLEQRRIAVHRNVAVEHFDLLFAQHEFLIQLALRAERQLAQQPRGHVVAVGRIEGVALVGDVENRQRSAGKRNFGRARRGLRRLGRNLRRFVAFLPRAVILLDPTERRRSDRSRRPPTARRFRADRSGGRTKGYSRTPSASPSRRPRNRWSCACRCGRRRPDRATSHRSANPGLAAPMRYSP